jgi:hypothetical protein
MNPRSVVRSFIWLGATVLLSTGWQVGCIPDPTSSDSQLLTLDLDRDKSTYVTPHLQAPIVDGQNLVWCATFQLAWDELCAAAGGDVHLAPPEDPMVSVLDRHPITTADLDPDSYLAIAGKVRDGIYARISQTMHDRFADAKPRLMPTPRDAVLPDDIVAYCYLFKKLDFPVPFERLDMPLDFAGTKVTAFGMAPDKSGHEKMAQNVTILDYLDRDDFLIELKIKSPKDHLVLAKIKPGKTLEETIKAVQTRQAAATPFSARPIDILTVPKMNFDIDRSYPELDGKLIVRPLATALGGLWIHKAVQNIRFQMDEKGVVLQSEAKMVAIGCSDDVPNHPLLLEFDKPFLLLMSREGGKHPYFAMWVNNPALLVKTEKNTR